MKANLVHKIIVIILFIFIGPLGLRAQTPGKIDGFSLRVSPGILSFHGDMSANSYNPFATIRDNSKFGFSFTAIKEFNNWIGIQAQYAAGNLYSIHPDLNEYFSGSVSEFGVSGRFAPLGLATNLKNKLKLQPYLTVGLATFGYRSCKRYVDTDEVHLPYYYGYENDGVTKTSRENGLAIPLGIGLSIPINQNLAIDIDHIYRITNTDVLDATVGESSKNDWYALTSVGIRFTIRAPESQIKKPVSSGPDTVFDPTRQLDPGREFQHAPMNIFVESLMDDVLNAGDVLAVNLRINKGSYTGPAKLIQRFPKGFSTLEAPSTNGRFSFNNQNVLIEWDNMPTDSMVSFTYFIRVNGDIAGSQTITSRFEYEEDDKWNTVRFNNYIFVDNKVQAQADQLDHTDQKIQDPIVEVKKELVVEKPKIDLPVKTVKEDPFLTKAPLSDVEFRIQCGAFKDSKQGGLKLAGRYGITEDMREVYENGWYKYTVGSFKSYIEAVGFKKSFINRTKLYSAFIVAYKNGKRVQNINEAFR